MTTGTLPNGVTVTTAGVTLRGVGRGGHSYVTVDTGVRPTPCCAPETHEATVSANCSRKEFNLLKNTHSGIFNVEMCSTCKVSEQHVGKP